MPRGGTTNPGLNAQEEEMKSCPACRTKLTSEDYEGARIWRCPECRGVFLSKSKLELIRHQRIRNGETLKAEARAEFQSDTIRTISCPGCGATMEKRRMPSRWITVTLDCCKACDGIWLDGGELAVAQLVFEASIRGTESLEFQRRMKELCESPERKAQFEAAVAALSERTPWKESLDEGWCWHDLLDGVLFGTDGW